MRVYDGRSNYEIMTNQAVELRDLIPDVVNGVETDSMVCSPVEVLGFTIKYIKELHEQLEEKDRTINRLNLEAQRYFDMAMDLLYGRTKPEDYK